MTQCSECGKTQSTGGKQEEVLDNGLMFCPTDMGYYGGFVDSFPQDEQVFVRLCHDCSVRLVRWFPSVAKALGTDNGHPCDEDLPCCEFAWKFEGDKTLKGTWSGKWVERD